MPDIAVIGGGPAGTTAATLLARKGYSVVLFERERFPRFQIGESLLPYNNDLFERLGVLDQLQERQFFPKYGAEFLTGDGQVGYIFRFEGSLEKRYARSFQVKRADFDTMLLRNAERAGVQVFEETTVTEVDLRDRGRALLNVNRGDGTRQTIEARFVIDASGHGAVIGNRIGAKSEVEELKKVSFFAHYRNVTRRDGRDAGNTVIVVLRDAWFWLIPLSEELTSVGLVVDRDHFLHCGLQPEELLSRTIEATPHVAERMAAAERVTTVMARKDFSYRLERMAGPNFALIGDAAGFLDPIFSTGVFLAMKSADIASAAVDRWLATGSMRPLKRYERLVRGALKKYFRFIRNFYRREFLEVFLQPRPNFGLISTIVGVLAGNVFDERSNRLRLGLFFALVHVQKRRPVIAPRIAWDTLPAAATAAAGSR